ncbi:MAG: sugar phosphate isomerase/epimerase [Ruminococcaceae bacterium]|nr:sugar phosphate isomerase/epimerase [Oscillospiraceae bacterium]
MKLYEERNIKMFKSINAWTIDSKKNFKELFEILKEAGFSAVELNVDAAGRGNHCLTMETTEEELKEIKSLADNAGIVISGISTSLYGGRLGEPTEEGKAFAASVVRKQLQCAKALGADGILVVPGCDINKYPLDTVFATVCEVFDSLKETIASYGISVGLENVWNGYFTSVYDMTRLIDAIGQEKVGAYFDVGNVIAFSNPVRWIEVLGKKIVKIHVKGYKRAPGGFPLNNGGNWCDLLEASTDWKEVVNALRNAGYESSVTAEVGPAHPYDDIMDFYKEVSADMDKILSL